MTNVCKVTVEVWFTLLRVQISQVTANYFSLFLVPFAVLVTDGVSNAINFHPVLEERT